MAHVDASDSAPEEVEPTIHTIGVYRNKAENAVAAASARRASRPVGAARWRSCVPRGRG